MICHTCPFAGSLQQEAANSAIAMSCMRDCNIPSSIAHAPVSKRQIGERQSAVPCSTQPQRLIARSDLAFNGSISIGNNL